MDKSVTGTARVMLFCLLALFALFLLAGLAVTVFVFPFAPPVPFALGLALSSCISGVKILHLDRALRKSSDMEPEKAKNYATAQMVLRFAGTVAILLLAVFLPDVFNVYGVAIGLLLLQLSAYVCSFVIKKRPDLAGLEH